MPWTLCYGCPCLNNDYEEGSTCNLGADVEYRWFSDEGAPRGMRLLTVTSDPCPLLKQLPTPGKVLDSEPLR